MIKYSTKSKNQAVERIGVRAVIFRAHKKITLHKKPTRVRLSALIDGIHETVQMIPTLHHVWTTIESGNVGR